MISDPAETAIVSGAAIESSRMTDFTAAAELLKQRQSGQSPYALTAEEMKWRQAGQIGMALTYDDRDPDASAESLSVGKELGVSPLIVDGDPEAYDARLRMKKAADALRSAPKTAAWLSDIGTGVLTAPALPKKNPAPRTCRSTTRFFRSCGRRDVRRM